MAPRSRPEVGAPIHVRLGEDLLAKVDAFAKRASVGRAAAVRSLIRAALAELDDETIGGY
jgi:metal-responsive CopG/Arc/MetJ family transcriptional regulator